MHAANVQGYLLDPCSQGLHLSPVFGRFWGAEKTRERAETALFTLEGIMVELGVKEAKHKVCQPATRMVWLGLWYDSVNMTISIPEAKLHQTLEVLRQWEK